MTTNDDYNAGNIMDECHLTETPVVTEDSTKVADSTMPWPLQGIEEPHENDVLCGRGGGTNNRKFLAFPSLVPLLSTSVL